MPQPSSLFNNLVSARANVSNRQIWRRAWPMIIANISTPLLGFVDTAVIGHLPDTSFLAGTALATLLISVLVWLLGFLRMSTTALVAEGKGAGNHREVTKIVIQGLLLAFVLSGFVLMTRDLLFQVLVWVTGSQSSLSATAAAAKTYFDIRIWALPISLCNFVFVGYLLGLGKTKLVLVSVVLANLINLIADLVFVPILHWQVAGVAWASVIAEVCQGLCLLVLLKDKLKHFVLPLGEIRHDFFRLLTLNGNIFLRSACLQGVLSFMTLYAVRFGDLVVATNAILMQFFLFISFCLDGIAFALESLIGHAKGQGNVKKQLVFIRRGCLAGCYLALMYTCVYLVFTPTFVSLLTGIEELKESLSHYYFWIVTMPLVSFLSFVLDGVFIGLVWITQMRNSMCISALVFFLVFSLSRALDNYGIWLAFFSFMAMRGLSQLMMLRRLFL